MFEDIVSIVLPIYNQELYLNISIPAVQNQSYKKLEIICVNDGSTDSSSELISMYAEKDERIKIISQPNGGLVSAVEAGINSATGTYLCFLDPDDFIDQHFIEIFMEHIDDCDVVSAGYYSKIGNTEVENVIEEPKLYFGKDLEYLKREFLFDSEKGNLSRKLFVARWNKLYRTKCVKAAMQSYHVCRNVSLGEDTLFTYLILCNAKTVKTLKVVNSYYYTVASQI